MSYYVNELDRHVKGPFKTLKKAWQVYTTLTKHTDRKFWIEEVNDGVSDAG